MAVRDAHLVHPARQEVVSQMQPPVVPGATRLTEGTRVYQYEATRWTGTRQRRGLWSSQQLTQQPEQPVVTGPQTLAPRGLGDVCKANQSCPRPQASRGQWLQHVGQQPTQQVMGSREATDTLKGLEHQGLLG